MSTVATTAVLVASSTLLDSLVEHTLQALLIDLDYRTAGTVQVGLIDGANAMRGVTIALHPAARRFHEEGAARAPASR